MCRIDPHFAEPGPGVFLAPSEWSLPGIEGEVQGMAVGLALPQPSSVDWDQEGPPPEITTGGIDPIPTSWLRPATGFLPPDPEFKPELITDPCWLPPPPSCWQPPLTEEGIAEPGAVDQLTGLEYQSEINVELSEIVLKPESEPGIEPEIEGEVPNIAECTALPQPASVDWEQESPPERTTGGIDPIPTSWLRPATGFLPRHPEFKPELITDPCWLPPPPSCWQPPLTEEGIAEPGAVDQLTGLEYQSEINIDLGTQIDGEWSIPISYEVCQKPFVFSYQIRTADTVTALTSQAFPSETDHSEQVRAFASWSNLTDSAEYLEASNNIEATITSESQVFDRQSAHELQAVDTPSAPTEIATRSISAERAVIADGSGRVETTVLAEITDLAQSTDLAQTITVADVHSFAVQQITRTQPQAIISRSSEPARVNDVVADESQEGSAEAFADSALSLLINSSLSQSGIAAMPPFAISDQPTTVDALFSSRRFVRAAKSYPR